MPTDTKYECIIKESGMTYEYAHIFRDDLKLFW